MDSWPRARATDTRWGPSRTKKSSPSPKTEIGGSPSPRRMAAAIRSQRPRTRPDVGRKARSNSRVRSTVPTIASMGMLRSPSWRSPTRPSASRTSSKGRIMARSPDSRRSTPARRCSCLPRRARRKSVLASACGNPVERAGIVTFVPHDSGGSMSSIRSSSQGILADDNAEKREEIIGLLTKAYWMELETVMSYLANSITPDGVRAQEIIESLKADVQEELTHAQQFGERIKELYGVVPGSLEFTAEQSYLQPPEHQTDIVHVIKGVIEAETGAIEHYNHIVELTDQIDFVTQDMVIEILRDEEGHRRLFEGYLREYEAEGLA